MTTTPARYVECAWFHGCHQPSTATVDHPTLGPVECCAEHVAWITTDYSPTKLVPPIAARTLARHPSVAGLIAE